MQTSPFTKLREGQEVTVECPHCHRPMHALYFSAGVRATCGYCRRVTNFRFSSPAARAHGDTLGSSVALLLGLVLIVGGFVLVIGNLSGAFPTFPFAGFLVSSLGSVIFRLALGGND